MIRALHITTPCSNLAAIGSDDGIWLSGGNVAFRIDDRGRIVATHHIALDERTIAVVGKLLIVEADSHVRAIDVTTGIERWRTPLAGATRVCHGDNGSGARWWYVRTEKLVTFRELDLARGTFRDRFESTKLANHAWCDHDMLVVGRGRTLVRIPRDGEPVPVKLRDPPGDAARGPVPFAGSWYLAGDQAGEVVVQPISGGATISCPGALDAVVASSAQLAVLVRRDTGMIATCWRAPDAAPAEVALDTHSAWIAAVGPAVVVVAGERVLVSTVAGSPGWIMLANPLKGGSPAPAMHQGRPWIVVTHRGSAVLYALDDLRVVTPGPRAVTLHGHAVTPAGVRGTVTSVGATSRAVVVDHPAHGRVTFVDTGSEPLTAGEEIEILERRGTRVVWRRGTEVTAKPTTTVLEPPEVSEAAASPRFKSSRALARWQKRVAKQQVSTPPALVRLFELYDQSASTRTQIVAAIGELDPDATLEADVYTLLHDAGDRRVLFGFVDDVEGITIGLVAGSPAVWSYDDGALVEVAASVDAWIERRLAQGNRPALAKAVRALLAPPPPASPG
ncbi:MAG: hypothetical protein ABI867_02945 [Kofleriaceae bacterium]